MVESTQTLKRPTWLYLTVPGCTVLPCPRTRTVTGFTVGPKSSRLPIQWPAALPDFLPSSRRTMCTFVLQVTISISNNYDSTYFHVLARQY